MDLGINIVLKGQYILDQGNALGLGIGVRIVRGIS